MSRKDVYLRTELLLGEEAMEKLYNAKVAIFGIGGVGGYVTEALARSGVSGFLLVDSDTVSESNINRQIIALHSTVGKSKVSVMKERILDINPEAQVEIRECFYLPENADEFDFSRYDYIIDAVDTVTAKINIIMKAKECNTPVISAMGAGNKLNPTEFKVADIYKTKMCPLAKVMRTELKKRGVKDLKVVYSEELPIKPNTGSSSENLKEQGNIVLEAPPGRRSVPGSIAFVPSVAGLVIASEVIQDLVSNN